MRAIVRTVRTIALLCHCVYAKQFQTWLLKRGFRMGLSCFNSGISKRKSAIELKSTYMPSHQMHARIQKYDYRCGTDCKIIKQRE